MHMNHYKKICRILFAVVLICLITLSSFASYSNPNFYLALWQGIGDMELRSRLIEFLNSDQDFLEL